jgi:hypothetical protein
MRRRNRQTRPIHRHSKIQALCSACPVDRADARGVSTRAQRGSVERESVGVHWVAWRACINDADIRRRQRCGGASIHRQRYACHAGLRGGANVDIHCAVQAGLGCGQRKVGIGCSDEALPFVGNPIAAIAAQREDVQPVRYSRGVPVELRACTDDNVIHAPGNGAVVGT